MAQSENCPSSPSNENESSGRNDPFNQAGHVTLDRLDWPVDVWAHSEGDVELRTKRLLSCKVQLSGPGRGCMARPTKRSRRLFSPT